MTYPHSHRTAATRHRPQHETAAEFDACLLDDEFDDSLDRHVATIRESLADPRDF